LPSAEDRRIWDWFAAVGLPAEALVNRVLEVVAGAGGEPVGLPALERAVDLRRTRLEALLKILDVDGAVERVDGGWVSTGRPWAYDDERVSRIRAAREAEAEAMLAYGQAASCLLEQLRAALDDPGAEPCGRCQVCTGAPDPVVLDREVVRAAVGFLRGIDVVLEPRKQWPRGLDAPRGNIKADERAEEGRALCREGDAGWWPAVAAALEAGATGIDRELVDGIAACLKRWPWPARPTWVTWVPSTRPGRDELLAAIAAALAGLGSLEVAPVLRRTRPGPPQAELGNGPHRCRNVWGAFEVAAALPGGPVLLLDDAVDSGWTMTTAAALLRQADAPSVLPFALVRR
jgi:ATP-dependent DNA helicase RecQ